MPTPQGDDKLKFAIGERGQERRECAAQCVFPMQSLGNTNLNLFPPFGGNSVRLCLQYEIGVGMYADAYFML